MKINYPSVGIVIVVEDKSIPAQAKLAFHVVMMSGAGLKSLSVLYLSKHYVFLK